MRHRLAPDLAAAAEARALALDVGADEVLIAAGHLTAEDHLRALAFALRLPFEDLVDLPRARCPLGDGMLLRAEVSGLLPLRHDGGLVWLVAPRGLAARRLVSYLGGRPELRARLRITTPERLRGFVQRHAAGPIAFVAADAFAARSPLLSAASEHARLRWSLAVLVAAFAAVWLVIPPAFHAVWQGITATVFLAWTILRLAAACVRPRAEREEPPPPDRDLPTYTILAALHREAETLPKLVAGLRALDYPPEKLDIKIILEPHDHQTRAAAARLRLSRPFEIVLAPPGGPQTKPKALNAALPFARGEFTVIFDAEDVPEPGQLRRAVAAFRAADDRLACLQASLAIDNVDDNWLTRIFTAEYASLFDVLLPGLAQRGLPIPLGGSSNHFRTDILRRVGAWDPFNVTEDADLGTRLARRGFRVGTLPSSTLEEAPSALGPWLTQRTRWFKGWLQTWLVHMREPVRLWRELGPAAFLTFQLMIVGTVFAALVQPFALFALFGYFRAAASGDGGSTASGIFAATLGAAWVAGYLACAALGLLGLARRGLLSRGWALVGVPALWALLTVAAWRAVVQLVLDPYRWEKTPHGLARTSRAKNHRPAN